MLKHIYIPLFALMATICAGAAVPALSPAARILEQTPASRGEQTAVPAYITVDPDALDRQALSAAGVSVGLEIDTLITARIPLQALAEVAALPGVMYVQTADAVGPMMDVASLETGAWRVTGGDGLPRPFTGKGVVVGFVDSGFDYGHAAFRSPDGSCRILRVWEQGATTGPAPEGFGYGTELTTPEEIAAAGGDIRNNSHGTHVASIAAGADIWDGGSYTGMAPEADIVLVSMTDAGASNVCISDAIAYIFDYAARLGRPCVVNLSLGSQAGPHDGTSPFDRIADSLQGPGRLIVGASGNFRAQAFHVSRDFSGEADMPVRTFIDFRGKASTGTVEVWGTPGAFQLWLTAVKTGSGEVAERVQVDLGADPVQQLSLGRNISGSVMAAAETSPLNGKCHVLLESAITSVRTGYAVAIEVMPVATGRVDIWADNVDAGLSSLGVDGYEEPGSAPTVSEIGGTASRILTVGAYATRPRYQVLGETESRSVPETEGDLCTFSSCGPTADGRMKPQITAPGSMISAAVSSNDGSGTRLLSAHHSDGTRDHLYGYMQGTSMASPYVAGMVATWLEAYPALTPELLQQAVAATARTDIHTGDLTGGSNLWGWGKADPRAGIQECLRLNGDDGVSDVVADRNAAARLVPGGVLFLRDMSDAVVEIFSAAGQLLYSRRLPRVAAGETVPVPASTGHRFLRVR